MFKLFLKRLFCRHDICVEIYEGEIYGWRVKYSMGNCSKCGLEKGTVTYGQISEHASSQEMINTFVHTKEFFEFFKKKPKKIKKLEGE